MYDPQDYDDLPDDIVSELSQSNRRLKPTKESLQILQLISDCGGSATANQIIIGLFRKHAIKTTRTRISARLSYMRKAGHLTPVKKQGVFVLSESSTKYLAKAGKSAPEQASTKNLSEKQTSSETASKPKPKPEQVADQKLDEPANVNTPRTITCTHCETIKTFAPGKIIFKFDGEEFCTPDCIKEYREDRL